jgi:CheY-like chemotaxis protein
MRTPLNGILGLTQVLLDRRPGPEDRELLEMIKASGESLLRVLNDILDYSKIQSGKIKLEPAEFPLRRWLRQSVALHAPQAHRKGLQISYWVASDVPDLLLGDAQRLRQVLWNLIANAIKFTEKGEILVEVRSLPISSPASARLQFAIADTGVGVPAADRSAIFEAFRQGENARPEQGGLGLGLAISKEIVARMGGTLEVAGEEGGGSRFAFEVELGIRSETPYEAPSFPGVRALVVDESPWQREALAKELRALAIEVEIADSWSAGLNALRRASFHLLLVDARRLDEALSFSRQARELAPVPVVLLLMTHHRVPLETLRSHEVAGTLTRPVAPTHLARALEILRRGERVEKPEDVQTHNMDRPLLAGCQVLLAEDHPVNRTVAIRLLENLGAVVTAAVNGREALELWSRQRFDIVVLDLEMPELDGFGVAREIRSRERGTSRRLPIVALTAHAGEEQRQLSLAAGMDGFVSKPFAEAELASAMGAALNAQGKGAAAVLDREKAMARASGDRGLLVELAGIFLEETPETLSRIAEALEKDDAKSIARLAHRLKGALLTLAAPAAAESALALEQSPEGAPAREAFGRLQKELSRLEEELKGLLLEPKL